MKRAWSRSDTTHGSEKVTPPISTLPRADNPPSKPGVRDEEARSAKSPFIEARSPHHPRHPPRVTRTRLSIPSLPSTPFVPLFFAEYHQEPHPVSAFHPRLPSPPVVPLFFTKYHQHRGSSPIQFQRLQVLDPVNCVSIHAGRDICLFVSSFHS